jgi:hypothetical protein
MKHRTILTLITILVVLLSAVGTLVYLQKIRPNDMPGTVYGSNPHHIQESKLPECYFDDTHFAQQPCYAPPGVIPN